MTPIAALRKMLETGPGWPDDGMDGQGPTMQRCLYCETLDWELRHTPDCPWHQMPVLLALLETIEAIDIEHEGQTYQIADPMMVVTLAKDRLKMSKELERLALLSAPIEFSWKRLLSWR